LLQQGWVAAGLAFQEQSGKIQPSVFWNRQMIDQQPAFAKFRLNKDLEISEAYIISTEEADVIDWTGKKSDTAEVRPDEAALPSPNAFKGLYKSFVNDALAFYRTVPFVMAHIQLIVKMRRDFSVRQEIEQNAISSNKTAEFESYTFPANLTASINRKIEELDAVEAGIKVLPNLFTIGLITMYDTHFAQLMKAIMRSKPHSISESNKNITFKDLSEIGTIAGAQERIMDREIDDVMRSNHVAQLEWIEKAVPIDLMKDNPILPKFVEVCERRNLLTHTGGKVSPQYLQVCKKHGVDMGLLKIGDLLRPNSAYIRSASLLVFEFWLKLIQV
jgi:hypothetical protein